MKTISNFSFVILCGGKSSRMGQDKGLLQIKNQYLVNLAAKRLNIQSDKIFISSNNPEYQSLVSYTIIPDKILDIGPIGGIYSVLCYVSTPFVFFLTCDSPEIDFELFQLLFSQMTSDDKIVLPQHNNQLEPLLGIYATELSAKLGDFIKKQNYSLYKFAIQNKARIIEIENEFSKNYFINLNTPEQLKQYLENNQ